MDPIYKETQVRQDYGIDRVEYCVNCRWDDALPRIGGSSMRGLVFIEYAIETPRDEAPLHAASTPGVEAVLAAGYRDEVGTSNEAMACTLRLGLRRGFVLILSGRCAIAANLIPSL